MLSILEIVREVAAATQFDAPETLVGSEEPEAQQFLALAHTLGDELARFGDASTGWPSLIRKFEVSIRQGEAEYDLPTDYLRVVGQTFWRTDDNREVPGVLSAAQAQTARYTRNPISTNPGYRFFRSAATGRVALRFDPDPTEDADGEFEYVSLDWIETEPGPPAQYGHRFTADGNLVLLDDWLFRVGLRAAWKQEKNLPGAAADRVYFEGERSKRFAEAVGVRPIVVGSQSGVLGLGGPTVSGPITSVDG